LELAAELGLSAHEADLRAEELQTADEAFITSTAGGVMPVAFVDGHPLREGRPGPITSRLHGLYWEKREAGWLGTPVAELLKTPVP
jgi:branched-chain amino acid aminotransferase